MFGKKRGKNGKRPGPPVHDDLVKRGFSTDDVNELWLTHITEHWTHENKLYLCAIKDVLSGRTIGCSISDRMKACLAVNALDNAISRRRDTAGCIVHSDRGSQSVHVRGDGGRVRGLRFAAVDRATGVCWDNAGAEPLWSTFKHEYYYRRLFATKAELVAAVGRWVERYNHRRQHSSIGQLSPIAYEVASTTAASAA